MYTYIHSEDTLLSQHVTYLDLSLASKTFSKCTQNLVKLTINIFISGTIHCYA